MRNDPKEVKKFSETPETLDDPSAFSLKIESKEATSETQMGPSTNQMHITLFTNIGTEGDQPETMRWETDFVASIHCNNKLTEAPMANG